MAPLSYIWLGLVLGVSFLATPVKFRAPSLTLPVALDVGRFTFHAFGAVEIVLSVALAVVACFGRESMQTLDWLLVGLVLFLVAAERTLLIPRLDVRVEAIIGGQTVPDSHLHLMYVGAEAFKSAALLALGAWTARHLISDGVGREVDPVADWRSNNTERHRRNGSSLLRRRCPGRAARPGLQRGGRG